MENNKNYKLQKTIIYQDYNDELYDDYDAELDGNDFANKYPLLKNLIILVYAGQISKYAPLDVIEEEKKDAYIGAKEYFKRLLESNAISFSEQENNNIKVKMEWILEKVGDSIVRLKRNKIINYL